MLLTFDTVISVFLMSNTSIEKNTFVVSYALVQTGCSVCVDMAKQTFALFDGIRTQFVVF